MVSERWSLTVSPELAAAIDALVRARGDNRSNLVETLLRENAYVRRAIDTERGLGASSALRLKRGRDPEKLRAIAEAGRQAWQRAEREGKVRFRER